MLLRALAANAFQLLGVSVVLYALFLMWAPLAVLGGGAVLFLAGVLIEGRK